VGFWLVRGSLEEVAGRRWQLLTRPEGNYVPMPRCGYELRMIMLWHARFASRRSFGGKRTAKPEHGTRL
jgi:hypothetical protein